MLGTAGRAATLHLQSLSAVSRLRLDWLQSGSAAGRAGCVHGRAGNQPSLVCRPGSQQQGRGCVVTGVVGLQGTCQQACWQSPARGSRAGNGSRGC